MKANDKILLGIETGGTKTIVIEATTGLRQVARLELGPANLRLISDRDFFALLTELKSKIGAVAAIGIGLPGMRTAQDEGRVKNILAKVWPRTPARVTHDLDLVVQAADLDQPASKHLT